VKLDVDCVLIVVHVKGPVDVDFEFDGWVGKVKTSENEVREFQT
jgi:hypothetical protein